MLTTKLGQQFFLVPLLIRHRSFWSADYLIANYIFCSCRHARSSGQNHYLLSHGFIADLRPVSFLGAIPQRCPHFVQAPLLRPFVGTPGCSLRRFCCAYFGSSSCWTPRGCCPWQLIVRQLRLTIPCQCHLGAVYRSLDSGIINGFSSPEANTLARLKNPVAILV